MARNINLRGIIPADYNYREYRPGDTADEKEGLNGKFRFVQYSDGENNVRGIEGMVAYYTMNATAGGNRTRHEVTCDYGGNTTSRKFGGIICGRNTLTFPDGGGIVADGDGVWIQEAGPSVNDLWTDGSVAQGHLLCPSGAATADGHTVGQNTGAVATDAVTVQSVMGRFTDTTNINLDTSRTAITLTNGHIVASDIITLTPLFTPTANAMLAAQITPGAGSAIITMRNVSAAANNTADMTWGYVIETARDKVFGRAIQDDETTEVLCVVTAGHTGTLFEVGETVEWAGGSQTAATATIRRIYQSIAAGVTTQWAFYIDGVDAADMTGAITGNTSTASATPASHNGTNTFYTRLRAQNVELSLAA